MRKILLIIGSFFSITAFCSSEKPHPEGMDDSELSNAIYNIKRNMADALNNVKESEAVEVIAGSIVDGFDKNFDETLQFTTQVLHWGTDTPESFYRLLPHERKSRRLSQGSLDMVLKIQDDFTQLAGDETAFKKDIDDCKLNSNENLTAAFKSNKPYFNARAARKKGSLNATKSYTELVGERFRSNQPAVLSLVRVLTQTMQRQKQGSLSKEATATVQASLEEINGILKQQPEVAIKIEEQNRRETEGKQLAMLLPNSGVTADLLLELRSLSPHSRKEIVDKFTKEARSKNDAKRQKERTDARQPQKSDSSQT